MISLPFATIEPLVIFFFILLLAVILTESIGRLPPQFLITYAANTLRGALLHAASNFILALPGAALPRRRFQHFYAW